MSHPTVVRLLTLPITLTLLSGCGLRGSGTPATELRELDSFDTIELSGAYELVVHVEPGAAHKVEVTADDNIVPKITTTISGGELDIGHQDDIKLLRPRTKIRVEVWTPSLLGIDASGASDVEVEGLHGERFELRLSGVSDSTLGGAVDRFDVEISGAGELDGKGLQAKVVTVELSGAGEASVWASESLDVEISGAGEVSYWGSPARVSKQISGAGELRAGT
ncbi:MAG TPA: head GIN domain-containing protein [Enhygromyxa sp.]|nr:head GIN domain-containing protein [Enhygromyxa sp.]